MDYNKIAKIGIVVAWALFIGAVASMAKEPAMSQKAYSLARSVRICAEAENQILKCGTGVFVDRNTIMTAFHVVSPETLGEVGSQHAVTPRLMVLREDGDTFESAVLTRSYPDIDIAILHMDGVAPSAILFPGFTRGDKVWAVGNPGAHDFVVVETTIIGIQPMPRSDGKGFNELIVLDAKGNEIRSGFSGGGIFSEHGMIGILQLCASEMDACLAMPTRVISKTLNGESK